MKTFTIKDIRSWNPRHTLIRWLPEGWSGTALDVLNLTEPPARDKLWCVLRPECIDEKTLRLFAARCARRALSRLDNPNLHAIAACGVAERYAYDKATNEELSAAETAAWAAVEMLTETEAWASRAAVWTVRLSPRAAWWAAYVARLTAAAKTAARTAEEMTTEELEWLASSAERSAEAETKAQVEQLKSMLTNSRL